MPFEQTAFEVKDGRNAAINNSGFGTVYGVVDGEPLPVYDYAGFAPLASAIAAARRTAHHSSVRDFLRKVWKSGIAFGKLDIANPEPLPIGPTTVISNNVGLATRLDTSNPMRTGARR